MRIKTLQPVRVSYPAGIEIDIDDTQAMNYIACGAVLAVTKKADADKTDETKKDTKKKKA